MCRKHAEENGGQTTADFTRLPTNVVPKKYYVDYEVIDLLHYRFEGSQRIELLVNKPTTTITCHAVELYVFNVSVEYQEEDGSTKTLPCRQLQFLPKDETVTFHFDRSLPKGKRVTLRLQFHGFLNDQLRGFYRTDYQHNDETRVMAVTQFEACDARRAFVCWDEPAIKATFEISMVTDVDLLALSNMHVVQTLVRPRANAHIRRHTRNKSSNQTTEKLWKFAETPIMSTYLVAMVVGEFDSLTAISNEGVVVNVYTAPGQSARGVFSLDVATRALSFFAGKFGIPYPLKKLDMVAVPNFLGAMENWGLVTYTESMLLVDPQMSGHATKVEAARTVCHELSHQWFGNLVTMEWWTGLWLNEGFAQFMEIAAVDHIFPEWHIWELFVQQVVVGSALVQDAMVTSHPIEVTVHHPSEADEIFDAISYHKGSSIVRMLSDYVGSDVFYKGVHEYLVRFSYQNTVTEDLWAALEHASGQNITEMARSWTTQVGFPLLTVQQHATNGPLTLVQERFFADHALSKDDHSVWDVPLTVTTSDDPQKIKRIGIWGAKTKAKGKICTPVAAGEAVTQQIQLPNSENSWIKLNPKQSSFYLVNYPSFLWKRLQQPVKDRILGVEDRVSLLNSTFALAAAGVLPLAQALDFTTAYVNESEFLCWKEIASRFSSFSNLFKGESFYPELQRYICSLFAHVMSKLTWDPTPNDAQYGCNVDEFRKTVITQLGSANDHTVIAEAQRRFHAYVVDKKHAAFSPDLRCAVFSIQIAHGDAKHVQQLQQLCATSSFAEERGDALAAIGRTPLVANKRQVLNWAFANVRAQDIGIVARSVARDQTGAQAAWEIVQEQWDELARKYSPLTMGALVSGVISGFHSEASAVEVEAFLNTKDTTGFERRLNGALENVKLRSRAFLRDREALAQWLKARAV